MSKCLDIQRVKVCEGKNPNRLLEAMCWVTESFHITVKTASTVRSATKTRMTQVPTVFMWQPTVKTYSCFCMLPPFSLHLGLFTACLMIPTGSHVRTQRRDESQKHPNKGRAQQALKNADPTGTSFLKALCLGSALIGQCV